MEARNQDRLIQVMHQQESHQKVAQHLYQATLLQIAQLEMGQLLSQVAHLRMAKLELAQSLDQLIRMTRRQKVVNLSHKMEQMNLLLSLTLASRLTTMAHQ